MMFGTTNIKKIYIKFRQLATTKHADKNARLLTSIKERSETKLGQATHHHLSVFGAYRSLHIFLSVRLSAYISTVPSGRIYVKLAFADFCEKSVEKL